MATGTRSVFAEDSDDDSINTTTTEETQVNSDKEYDVEKILAEQTDKDGTMHYLLKWEGYPIHACTWETKDNIQSEALFREWEHDKRLAKQGQEPLFVLGDFEDAVERHHDEKSEKKRRRIVKRRRRGEAVPSSNEEDSDYEAPPVEPESPKRKTVGATPLKRNGIAQLVQKRLTIPTVTDEDQEEDSDLESLSGERETSASDPLLQQQAASSRLDKGSEIPRSSALSLPAPVRKQSAAGTKTSSTSKSADRDGAAKSTTKTAVQTDAARNSAPSAPAKPTAPTRSTSTSNVFGGDWTEQKKRKSRVRVSGETPKDSAEPKFTHLAIQNRYRKFSKNEPTPDPNALAIVDPKTGELQKPKAPPTKVARTEIHSAYGRRTPPPAPKGRSPTPPSSRLDQTGAQVTIQPPLVSDAAVPLPDLATSSAPDPIRQYPKRQICKDWLLGSCRFPADRCMFAHSKEEGAVYPRAFTTCFYWQNGKCRKTAAECHFAHWDTGEYAGPPGTYRERPMIHEADLRLVGQAVETSVLPPREPQDLTRKTSLAAQTNAVSPSEPQLPPLPLMTHSHTGKYNPAGNGDVGIANSTSISSVSDPRLRGRTAPTINQAPVTSEEPRLPTATEEITQDIPDLPPIDDLAPSMHGSIVSDIKMAERGKSQLDASILLAVKDRQPIKNVFIHMPSERKREMDILKVYFKDLNCEVYLSTATRAWDYFRKTLGKLSLLVVHPSESFISTLPGLNRYLVDYGSGARVFSIGVQYQQCLEEKREPTYEARRLFPHGGITFITDDIFVYYPEKATEIIERFLVNTKDKPLGGEFNKIGARPCIKDWLERLALDNIQEQGGPDKCTDVRYLALYDAMCRLCPVKDEILSIPGQRVPRANSYLWGQFPDSLPSFEVNGVPMPDFMGRWESGDEEGATDYMAHIFANWATYQAWKYRNFSFVYQRPEGEEEMVSSEGQKAKLQGCGPKGWANKWSHISVVTPDEVLKSRN